ncbi:hypothetical protein BGZ96_009796 [Linnemannia gamsii]|uniref:Transmembrane protein n=1 Tax=Linnemannia gamsii TaxID=64522 RepID=A0ABQ7JWG3_9FUNG|nr:hypothetical protein BGZ96_009796 [Linnemannia gamsii]
MSPTLSTLSSEASSSTAQLPSIKQHRTITKATLFLITLTLACCLLSTSTTTFSLAAPASKPRNKSLLRQRTLAQQVHHVLADESVHNNVVLLKKSIQKRKSQKRSQPQQQQGHTTLGKERTKRHGKREIVDTSLSKSSSESVDHGQPTANEDNNNGITATANEAFSSSSISDDSGTIQQSNKHRKAVQKKKSNHGHRARLLSAYESIIFSESQIPVFLTQDHHQRHPQQRPLRPQHRRRQPKGAEKKNNPVVERHQNPIRAYNNDDTKAFIPSVVVFSSSGDDVAVAQADSPSSPSFSSSLDSELEQQQQHTTMTIVAQDSASSASNNNNLQNDHVAVGVTMEDEQSENDDKNRSLLASSAAFASPPAADVVHVGDSSSFTSAAIVAEEGSPSSSSSARRIEAVAIKEEHSQGVDSIPSMVPVEETAAVVIEDESAITTASIADSNNNEIEDEDGWVIITDAAFVTDSYSDIDSSVEFQSSESNDIPFSDTTNDRTSPMQHHQRATGTLSLFRKGYSSFYVTCLGGLFLIVIGLVYRFHIGRQRLQKQQARCMGSSLPLDAKAPLSTSSTKSVHRLSVDSNLKREGAGGESARTTAMRDYVGFNMQ